MQKTTKSLTDYLKGYNIPLIVLLLIIIFPGMIILGNFVQSNTVMLLPRTSLDLT